MLAKPWASGANNKQSCIDSEILYLCYFLHWRLQGLVVLGLFFFHFVNTRTCAGKMRVANWPISRETIFSKVSRVG